MRPALLAMLLVACQVTDGTIDTAPPQQQAVPLVLDRTEDVNGVVTTKGMGVLDDGRIALWNYNQDQLELWDGSALTPVASGLVTSFGTDLATSGDHIFVSKGDSGDGDVLAQWDAAGTAGWGTDGQLQISGRWLGLAAGVEADSAVLYAADADDGSVAVIRADGVIDRRIPVDDIPLDVAAGWNGELYVLTSTSTNPLADGSPVSLQRYDADGVQLDGPVSVNGGTYVTWLGGRVIVSVNDFTAETRSLAVFSTDLAERIDTALPAAYTGFVGGIDAHEGAIYVSAQEGTGSDPICDVLVYAPDE